MPSIAVIVSLLAGIAGQDPTARLKPEWGVVLPETEARAFWKPRLCNRPAPGPIESTWVPADITIRRLEAVLAPALQKAIQVSTIAQVKPDAGDFYRQYAGFVVGGQRVVYINGFHAKTVNLIAGRPTPWRTQALLPCDGGMLFFGAEFKLDTGAIERIIFNGG